MGNAFGRGVGAVGGGEGIVAIDIAERGEEFGHGRIVGFFHRREAGVLEKYDRVVGHCVDRLAARLFDEGHAAAKRGLKGGQGDPKAHLGDGFALGAAEVGHEDRRAACGENIVDGRHDAVDPGGVAHLSVFERHVDIDPHQHALALEVHVIQRFPTHLILRVIR